MRSSGGSTVGSSSQHMRAESRYRVLAELGSGGMAQVYLAVARGPSGFNKLVVLKALRKNLASDPEFLTMFLNEARLAARLNHPNVVQTYEVGEDAGQHVIVMEYLAGQPLSQILKRGRNTDKKMSLAMHLRVLADALAGLHYAHDLEDYNGKKLELVHRDVSPQNIFVTFEGQVKILDFGIAKAAGAQAETRSGVIKGKIRYMPPEQMAGEKVDRRADVFAVGALLWECATGQPLWKGESDVAIMHKVLSGAPPSPRSLNPECSQELERIILKAMSPSPANRHATAADLENDIEEEIKRMGATVRSRDVGAYVNELFADMRAETKAIVEQQLSKVASLTSGEYSHVAPVRLPTASGTSASGSMPTVDSGAMASTQPQPERKRKATPLVIAAVLAAAAAVLIVVLVTRKEEKAAAQRDLTSPAAATPRPQPATSTVAAPAEVAIELMSTPADAVLYLDEEKLGSNPFVKKGPADPAVHKLRAEAKGYVTRTMDVTFDKATRIVIALDRAPTTAAAPTGATKPPPTTSKAAPAPTPPTETAPPKPNCASPFYIDDRGIKKVRPECM